MPTFGLIVEGEADEAALSVLISKCGSRITLKTRQCRGTVLGKFRGLAQDLHSRYRPAAILIVCDADKKDPNAIHRSFGEQGLDDLGFQVSLIVIKEELEAWLLADPAALQKSIGVTKTFPRPENLPDPKKELQRLLPSNMAYTPQLARRIAEEIDLDKLARCCPRFEGLRRAVTPSRPPVRRRPKRKQKGRKRIP